MHIKYKYLSIKELWHWQTIYSQYVSWNITQVIQNATYIFQAHKLVFLAFLVLSINYTFYFFFHCATMRKKNKSKIYISKFGSLKTLGIKID